MFAFKLDYIKDDDIIVTSDVDTFVMDTGIFDPIADGIGSIKSSVYHVPETVKVWLLQYWATEKYGYTFNMNFIGMRKGLWRKVENTRTFTGVPFSAIKLIWGAFLKVI